MYLEQLCVPSPCGPYSQCREVNSHAVCSCQKNYFGSPPNCRPECVVSSECNADKSCVNRRCVDPCPGTCGLNARCQVVNHNAICSCQSGHIGDPFVRCVAQPSKTRFKSFFFLKLYFLTIFPFSLSLEPILNDPVYPCVPSPCGPNSICRESGNIPVCTCIDHYIGHPPNCRPECTSDSECPSVHSCINEKCRDPCPGSCGSSALCSVVNHKPMCRCSDGFTGDPFLGCTAIPTAVLSEPVMPCNPSPCGINAVCKERNGAGSCTCVSDYHGDPYVECRPECVLNSDCSKSKSCVRNKCVDPCPGVCGINAECRVNNHIPICNCLTGFTGNPSTKCSAIIYGKMMLYFFESEFLY